MQFTIYIIENSVNEKVYVGQTRKFSQRKAGHLYSARRGDERLLYREMREFGIDKFQFRILEECETEIIASEREQYWVNRFDSFNRGYNLTTGGGYHVGNKGRKFPEDHRRKISEAHKGKTFSEESRRKMGEATRKRLLEDHPMKGKTWSDEVRQHMRESKNELYASDRGEEIKQKISETLKDRPLSEETKQKISEAGKGRRHSEETIEKMKAHKFSDEHRRKLSEAAKRRYQK